MVAISRRYWLLKTTSSLRPLDDASSFKHTEISVLRMLSMSWSYSPFTWRTKKLSVGARVFTFHVSAPPHTPPPPSARAGAATRIKLCAVSKCETGRAPIPSPCGTQTGQFAHAHARQRLEVDPAMDGELARVRHKDGLSAHTPRALGHCSNATLFLVAKTTGHARLAPFHPPPPPPSFKSALPAITNGTLLVIISARRSFLKPRLYLATLSANTTLLVSPGSEHRGARALRRGASVPELRQARVLCLERRDTLLLQHRRRRSVDLELQVVAPILAVDRLSATLLA